MKANFSSKFQLLAVAVLGLLLSVAGSASAQTTGPDYAAAATAATGSATAAMTAVIPIVLGIVGISLGFKYAKRMIKGA